MIYSSYKPIDSSDTQLVCDDWYPVRISVMHIYAMAMTIDLKSNVYMAKSLNYHEYLERYNIVHCTCILTFDLEGQGHTC